MGGNRRSGGNHELRSTGGTKRGSVVLTGRGRERVTASPREKRREARAWERLYERVQVRDTGGYSGVRMTRTPHCRPIVAAAITIRQNAALRNHSTQPGLCDEDAADEGIRSLLVDGVCAFGGGVATATRVHSRE